MFFEVELLLIFAALHADHANGRIPPLEEFKDLNSSCHPIANCMQVRPHDNSPAISTVKPCSCHRMCSQFDTCCLDAPRQLKQAKVKPVCRRLKSSTHYAKSYFMVNRCSSGGDDDSVWEELCNDEKKIEDGDLMSQVPVTSLFTSITYRNYFCLRCHETTDDFVYWNLQLMSNESQELGPDMKHDKLVYSRQNKTWLVRLEESHTWLPVDLYLQIPSEIDNLPVECMPDIISQCNSSWPDGPVSKKCHSYTSITYISRNGQKFKYKNPHCAACYFEDLSKTPCGRGYAEGSTVDEYDADSAIDGYDDGPDMYEYDDGSIREGVSGGSSRDGVSGDSSTDRFHGGSIRDRFHGGSIRDRFHDSSIRDRFHDSSIRNRDSDRFGGAQSDTRYNGKILFSFTHLLDINRSDGDKVGKLKMCEDDSLWDPWADTCRELSCPLPGYILQARKCVPPGK